ncbi:MAG: MBOAT family protein, partial [Spirochaetota bacterium]|nr:MBOAT family protein [Spirochaetota bacterium]
ILFFAIQIYCDFSGYSDIAIGASQVMGYRLMDNFNRPYFSKSIAEFWKRWHISLSTWFKDYVYIPLGGNRVVKWRWYYNLLLVFLVSGLWHGANWTFVAWGGLHGFYMIVGLTTRDIRNRFVHWIRLNRAPGLYKYIRVIITFSLVCFAWIFFRAKDLSGAFYIVRNLFDGMVNTLIQLVSLNFNYFKKLIAKTKMSEIDFIVAVVSILFLEFIHSIQRHGSIRQMLSERPLIVRWLIYYILIFSIFLLGVFEKVDFIYFQF